MENNPTNETYHSSLVSSCAFCEFLYSLPFEKRIEMDLYKVRYYIELYPKNLRILSIKELEDKINSIKKPWWNDMYEEIHEDKRLLQIIYRGGCNLNDLQVLYKALKSHNMKKIDSMEKMVELKYKNTTTTENIILQQAKTKRMSVKNIIIGIVYTIAVTLLFYYCCIKKS